jgi:hypothetical protein
MGGRGDSGRCGAARAPPQARQVKRDAKDWRQAPRLERAFARKFIGAGHPTRAVELLPQEKAGVGEKQEPVLVRVPSKR